MKLVFIVIVFLLCAIFSGAQAWELPRVGAEGAVQDMQTYETIDNLRTPSLNGGNSTYFGHESDRKPLKATSRERVQIAVSGVHQYLFNDDESLTVAWLVDMQASDQAQLRAQHPEQYIYPTSKEKMREYAKRN